MKIYRTVYKEAEATQTIERSRFTAHIKPVETRGEAEAFISEIKGKHRDATHNVPAMVIGDGFQVQWASDDGEPQGTSGAPIVQMLVKEGITNVVVVVTRYFGGVKLGTGGLVRAYTSSVKLAIEEAGICDVMGMCRIQVEIDYTHLAKLQKLAGKEFEIENIEYGEKVTVYMLAEIEKKEDVLDMISNLTSGSGIIKNTDNVLAKKSLDTSS